MAANPNDIFASVRVGGAPASQEPRPTNPDGTVKQQQDQDIFSEFRVDQNAPDIRREDNTLGEEFRAGLGSGIDSMQGSLYGVAGLAGRELGIKWLEDAGNQGAAENFAEAGDIGGRQSQGFTDIESAGGFFRWASASLGEAIPSLAAAMTGGGIGAVAGKKAVELGVKKSVARRVERDLRSRMGFSTEEALTSVRSLMTTKEGKDMVRDAFLRGDRVIRPAMAAAGRKGAAAGAVAVSSLPQIGAIDQELVNAGVVDPGLTALLGGIAGGALEAVPALRLLDKMFPGIDRQVSKQFVKDFAVSTGTQAALEGSTEAAQEIIQLAALAYKDPTFDMFSPDAKRRVVDAFAAGALVGAVTGGGAEVIGGVQSGAFSGVKVAVPAIGAWSMTAKDKVSEAAESVLPEGFVPADKGVFEEIKDRVYSAVQPRVEAAVNSLQAQMDSISQGLNDNLEGGVNAESAKISDVARAAHNKFIEKHGDQIEKAKAFMDREVERIARAAKEIQDPEARAKFVNTNVEAVKEKLAGFVDLIRRKAAERDKQTEAEVDNMDLDDDILAQMGIEVEQEETERRVGPSGRGFERSVGPAVQEESSIVPKEGTIQSGETEAAPVLTFGRNQLSPKVGVDGKETVVPYKTKADARKGRTKLRARFPEAKNDSAFRIIQHESGKGWIIEAISPEMKESQKFFNDLDSARESASRTKNTARNNERKISLPVDGTKFGYKFKNLVVDLKTLAFKGKNIDPNAKTLEDGFLAMATEMLTRNMITVEQFNEMNDKFQEHFGEERNTDIDEFASPAKYPTEGVAKANMINFINKMKERGIKIPFNMLNTVKNDDGTYSWGIDDVRTFRALRQKSPDDAQTILQEIKKERRQEQLSDAAREEGEFSGNVVLDEGGDLADVRGDTAGATRTTSDPIRTGRTVEGKRTASRTKTGGKQTGEFTGTSATSRDTTPGEDDVATKGQGKNQARTEDKTGSLSREDERGSKLKSEFDTRHKRQVKAGEPGLDKFDRAQRNNAKELSKHDQRILNRYGRPGGFKSLTAPNLAFEIQSVIASIGHFVTKTLGLSNQVTFIDDHGLQLLIDRGLVTDPIFEQTLNDPSVNARNIRIGDQSFVYLSQKVLSDQAATVLAFSHEMGHHLYRVAWDKLTPEAQQRLKDAYTATNPTATGTKLTPKQRAAKEKKIVEFEAFVAKEKARIAKLPNMDQRLESQNEMRHQTQVGIDSLKAELAADEKIGQFDEAGFNEWMADQLAAWIARPIQKGGEPGRFFFQKVAQNIRKLYNFVANNKRFQLDETFKQFADAVALKAKTTTSQEANPYNAAVLKTWFRNEGVTMYEWFGDALETDNMDFTPVTAEGKKALARMEKNFPAVVKRAIVLRNWVVAAYKMVLAPSTSAVRDIAVRVKSASKLVTIFNREDHGAAKVKQNYHQAVELMRGQFTTKYTKITDGIEADIKAKRPGIKNSELQTLVNAKMREIGQSLQKKDGDPAATFTKEEQAVRDIFDQMHEYAAKPESEGGAGLPVRKVTNYFPRSFSRELLIANKQKILNHLTDGVGMPLAKARSLYNSLIDPNANDGRATFDATETPGFTAMNSRQAQDKFFDQFLDDNTQGIVANYINQVVKRAEFNRVLGEAMPVTELDAKEAIKKGLWDPKGKMHKILADAKNEGATDEDLVTLEKYIDANLGQLGRDDINPGMRKFMAGVMAYQNMRVLLFTVFASLPDLAGPAIRSGSMKDTFRVLKKNIHNMAKNDSAIAEMARAYGIIQDTASEHIMTEYVDNHYMPPKLRKWNDNFFKYTGLNWYTDFTRKYALAVGIDYLEQSYKQFLSSDSKVSARGKDMLAELGVKPAQVASWLKKGKPTYDTQSHDMDSAERKIAEALVQFVDESIMRPNASQRPILASHPGAMLVYHLKGYMYAVHDIILKRIKFNIDESETPAQYAAAIAPAIAMMLLTAVGLELRELIQYAGSNRKPPTDRMDGWEYTWELAQRSGLTGFAQIGIDLEGAEDRGMSHVAGIGGPTLSQAANIISRPSTQTIPKAIPVIGQIPAARSMVRDVIK